MPLNQITLPTFHKYLSVIVSSSQKVTLSAGAVEYTDCTSAEGLNPPNETTC